MMNFKITRRQGTVFLAILVTIIFFEVVWSYRGINLTPVFRPDGRPPNTTYMDIEWTTFHTSIETHTTTNTQTQPTSYNSTEAPDSSKSVFEISNAPHQEISAPPLDQCPVVNVAMLVSGHVQSRHVYLAIKSVLMHRSTQVHFHFITDNRARTVLKSMLNTWLVPGISHDYYDLKQAKEKIYSQIDCLKTMSLKLNLHQILPDTVGRVIVLEPTSVLKIDPLDLWSVTMSYTNHMITLCNGKCVSYCHNDPAPSVDTSEYALQWGAMGLNLAGMRTSAHTLSHALQSVRQCTPNDIYTALDKAGLFQNTADDWSPAVHTQQTCAKMVSAVSSHESNKEQDVCKCVADYDGNKLRYDTNHTCTNITPIVPKPPPLIEVCDHFYWEGSTRRREIPFLMGHSYNSSDEYDVTLINHVDYDRLSMIERSLTNWNGPVSLAIQVTETQVKEVVNLVSNSKVLSKRRNISYHLLFKIGPSYPINALRELAQKYVSTPYVFDSDIDFVYSYDMYTTIKQDLKKIGNLNKIAVVLPSFETDSVDFEIPRTKAEAVQLVNQDKMRQFHKRWFGGQGQTNYKRWKTAIEPYYIQWKGLYEPYTLVKSSVVPFDRRFVARFHDKGSRNTELHMAGFKFLVLHNIFMVHLPHPKNPQNKEELDKCSKQWYRDWVNEKRDQYNYYKMDVPDVFMHKR